MTANRDTLREGMAEAMLRKEYPSATLVPFPKQDSSVRAYWLGVADAALSQLAPILDKADSAEAAEARADQHSDEARALRDALDDSQSLLTMIYHAGPDRQFWTAESITTLLIEQITHNRVCLDRAALARAAVKAETEDREDRAQWKPTGSGSAGLNAGDGTVEWFRPSDGLIRSFPRHFDPNKGTYSGVTLTSGADLPPAWKEAERSAT